MKILYFDTETTGTDCRRNEITQLSAIIEIDGQIKDTLNIFMRPEKPDCIDEEALKVTGKTLEEVLAYPDRRIGHKQFVDFMGKYCNKFDRNDKYYPAGYNVKFDIDFLYQFFQSVGDKYLGSWLVWRPIDGLPLITYLEHLGVLKLENYKLSTVCQHFDIKIDAHDALSDISATREVIKLLFENLRWSGAERAKV